MSSSPFNTLLRGDPLEAAALLEESATAEQLRLALVNALARIASLELEVRALKRAMREQQI